MFQLVCNVCKSPVMTKADKQYIDDVVAKNALYSLAKMQQVWANLVQNGQEPNKPRRFHSMSIFRIVGAASDSPRSPEWVPPAALCPSTFQKTKDVLNYLESMLYDANSF